MTADRELQAVRALLSAARTVGRGTTSMRVSLAHGHALLDAGLLPDALRDGLWPELEEAAGSIEPLSLKDVEKVLKDAWGHKPSEELDDLEAEPRFVGPATQTHRAEREGEAVAVTVLRPGLAELVRADLALADRLVGPAAAAFPAVDVRAVVREARERVLDDLDLEHVAGQQRTLHRALRRHEELGVAAPITALCHGPVLVREHVEGTPVLELTDPAERQRAAELLIRFAGGAARHGTVIGDLHPANVVLARDGRLVVLEATGAAAVAADRADLVVEILDALADGDDAAGAAAVERLGVLPSGPAAQAAALGRDLLGPLTGNGAVTVDVDAARAVLERLDERLGEALSLIPHATLPPADLWPLRGLGQVVALVLRLGPTVDWIPLARDAARDGW